MYMLIYLSILEFSYDILYFLFKTTSSNHNLIGFYLPFLRIVNLISFIMKAVLVIACIVLKVKLCKEGHKDLNKVINNQ